MSNKTSTTRSLTVGMLKKRIDRLEKNKDISDDTPIRVIAELGYASECIILFDDSLVVDDSLILIAKDDSRYIKKSDQ